MKTNISSAVAILTGALMVFPFSAMATGNDPSSGDVVLFPGSGLAPLGDASAGNISVPLGWNIPGRNFRSGDGWWALSCESLCVLKPQRLSVRSGTHPDYDGPPLPSQLLSWSDIGQDPLLAEPAREPVRPIMLFKPIRSAAAIKLLAGPVHTWLHVAMGSYPGSKQDGKLETVIDLGADGKAVLMPRLMLPRQATGTDVWSNENESEQTLIFELRAYGKRQRLGAYEWDIEGPRPLAGPDYLLWAGDLDGDGKLDLLMSYASRGWNTALYLSTLAGPGEIVGEAGRFRFWQPDDPGC